jgi:uncharacterized protein YecT (DUF1311 family)
MHLVLNIGMNAGRGMTSKAVTGLVLVSLTAGLGSLSVLSWADDANGSPQWCAKAKTKVEKLICDGQLVELDREMGAFYEALVKMTEPSAKSGLRQSQKKWIAERERCGSTAKNAEELGDCVYTKIRQRLDFIRKRLQETVAEKRSLEFAEFQLKTYKEAGFEFQYPDSWQLGMTEDGGIRLKSDPEEMFLGFEKTVTDPKKCTYEEEGLSEYEVRRSFYQGKRQIGGQEFDIFHRSWIPSGKERHYYGFFNGRCFSIHVSDNSQAASNCGRIDDGQERANCEIAELEAKDLMAYSEGVLRTLRFLHDGK